MEKTVEILRYEENLDAALRLARELIYLLKSPGVADALKAEAPVTAQLLIEALTLARKP